MSATIKKKFQIVCVLLCAVLTILNNARAKPTIAFTLPPALTSIPSLSSYTHQFVGRKISDQMKSYSGQRFSNESLIMIYFNDQTIAVVELGPAKLLLNCELIEIYDDKEGVMLLQKLSSINKPLEITFKDMVKLMNQCDIVDKQNEMNRHPHLSKEQRSVDGGGAGLFPQNPFSLLSGIVPGTKWCGTGDIATSYSDLGFEKTMDRCCRQHDLCPVKIRAYQNRYNLINNSLYSKSHCTCDDMLFSCLKKTNTSAAQVMGSIYFNLVQVPCLQETPKGLQFRKAREGF